MKKVILVLESGEEILCGHASSLYKYLLAIFQKPIVPFHGNRDYCIVKNIYNEEHKQYVSYKIESHG